jgi:pSer/pThr/pTyr-binding forkhead associated (FHA) protein
VCLVKKPFDLTTDEKTVAHEVPLPVAVQRAKKPPSLEQIRGPGAPRDFVLELNDVVVGRSLQATISIEGSGVSRQHLALRRSDGEYTCADLNSANGMYLNGIKTHSAVLREGDTIQMGDVVFVFHEGS